ncbi:DNA/RNA non-specific endonuclease [Streptococcus sp. sy004]|uniref:DNA/RNA non-specific endonuclease n=1 Tax=Streptococcus sp. sy004 TaxID=2600149 RepID=UPI0016469BC4
MWSNALKAGKQVEVSIKLRYDGASKRPKEFKIRYKIDSQEFLENIPNISKP